MHFTCKKRQRFADRLVSRHATHVLQLKLRLKTLLDKKRVMQSRSLPTSKVSASFITLQEGFEQFSNDLNKLEVGAGGEAVQYRLMLW